MTNNILTILQTAIDTSSASSITLKPNEITFLKGLMETSPQLFSNIETQINEIINDGKLDYHDIPNVIKIVANLLTGEFTAKIHDGDIINIIQYIIDVILKQLPIPATEEYIIQSIVDTSFFLLKTNIVPIEKSCFRLFSLW